MLCSISMQCFRKHEDLTVNFTPGINAIRAENERGKSSMLEAIGYAFFGSKGLKEPIDDVVTYGLPATKLKVHLVFDFAGVVYDLKRSKSGAELVFPGAIVTGQTEVTRFVEGLFGVSADMASKLMLAKQKSLGGALAGGPTAAGKMIEDLAGLDLIDQLVAAIIAQLPSGNTVTAEARIESLRARAADVELDDFAELTAGIEAAQRTLDAVEALHADLKLQHDEQDVDTANAILADQKRLTAALVSRHDPLLRLEAALAAKLPVAPAEAEIESVRVKVNAQKGLATALKVHKELETLDTSVRWEGDRESLDAAVKEAIIASAAAEEIWLAAQAEVLSVEKAEATALSNYRLVLQSLEGRLVKETTCALCQKDLSDVPEVVTINTKLGKEIEELKAVRAQAVALSDEVRKETLSRKVQALSSSNEKKRYLNELQDAVRVADAIFQVYARAGDNITLDFSVVPAGWTWIGPTDEPQDYRSQLEKLENAAATAIAAGATRAAQAKQRNELRAAQAADQDELAGLPVQDAQETLQHAQALLEQRNQVVTQVYSARDDLKELEGTLKTQRALQEQLLAQQTMAKIDLQTAEAELADMQANNVLVKKLRAARPAITDKLWNLVLAAVSTYCSEVRGEASAITRADGVFKVNGYPVSGLSGSAEDALGLSIRYALVKTFLPNMDFVILDEVAAACDDQREVAMLGLLATAGLAQTILVTHSDLADAFSDNIITL